MSTLNIISSTDQYKEKEKQYLTLRTKENRLRTVEEIKLLPLVSNSSAHDNEWYWRKRSQESLIKYLEKTKVIKTILELGCGNGWLANHLSKMNNTTVYAVDLNIHELQQAHEAFTQDNLHFVYGDIFEDIFPGIQFDYIVLAASIQYFPSLTILIKRLIQLLADNGEIHIIDSNFYTTDTIEKAKQNTLDYFRGLNIETMTQYYFHHSIDEMNELKPIRLNKSINNRFEMLFGKYLKYGSYHIFPWFMLNKKHKP